MRLFTGTGFLNDTVFIHKIRRLVMTNKLLAEIDSWSKEVNMDFCHIRNRQAVDESIVSFGFSSEQDMSMFILRWSGIIEQEYRNTMIYQLDQMTGYFRHKNT